MSDILADIDDALADSHDSADSTRWTPGGSHEAEPFPVDLEVLWHQIIDVRRWRVTPAPKQPKRLDGRYQQRQKNRAKRRKR